METHLLIRWHVVCGRFKGPFKQATVLVSKKTRTAQLKLESLNPATDMPVITCMALSSIGTDDRDYREIAHDIIDIARQHGLLDEKSNVPVINEE
jgi:hypothetical protein